jgi:hypothetical protein
MPWNAEFGNAWWLFCHHSPNKAGSGSHTLRPSSDDLKFRRAQTSRQSVAELRDPERWAPEPRERVELHDVHGLKLPLGAKDVLAMAG